MLLVGLPIWYFFATLVRPEMDLGKDILYCLFPYYLFVILCNLILRYVLLLYHMLVLFPLSGASSCTVYLFIILIYIIVKSNVLLFLCISIPSNLFTV